MRLRYIILPELKPTFLFVIVIATLNAVTQVDHVFVMTKGGPANATNLVLFYIYQQAVEHYDVGRASAATLETLAALMGLTDRKSTRLNSSHIQKSRMPSSA